MITMRNAKMKRSLKCIVLPMLAIGLCGGVHAAKTPTTKQERLYNGIELAIDPRDRTDMTGFGRDPLPVPYLANPPKVIPVDVGRQLFVDDFLIAETTFTRTWHKAVKDNRSPVMKPETALELGTKSGHCPMAAPFSGGVWYDGRDKLFKAWYCAGWFDGTAYATSTDGITWTRPNLKAVPGTNLVVPPKGVRDSAAVVLDPDVMDGNRFKMLIWSRPQGGELFVSSNGTDWSAPVVWGSTGDRSTIFYNPFRRVWVYSIRSGWHARSREYAESVDFLAGASLANRVKWLRADKLDLPADCFFYAFPERKGNVFRPALYNLDAVAYESLMLGAFTIMTGPENNHCEKEGVPKMTELHLGFSRDGFHFSRPDDRTPFIPGARAAGAWDRAYLHSNAAICLVMGDELWFHYTGFAGDPARRHEKSAAKNGMYANASMGLARLRRDGFASMDSGAAGGTLTTRPIRFATGDRLFLNLKSAPTGTCEVEVLDDAGRSLKSQILTGVDSTCVEVKWPTDTPALAELKGQPIRLRFTTKDTALYAFWFSGSNGASRGYLAGGAPGHATLRDLEGCCAK